MKDKLLNIDLDKVKEWLESRTAVVILGGLAFIGFYQEAKGNSYVWVAGIVSIYLLIDKIFSRFK